MDKSSTFLKKLVKKPTTTNTTKVNIVTPSRTSSSASKHITITIPAKLTQAQKEAALPFLTQEPPPPNPKHLHHQKQSRFFKKLAKASPAKDCLKSSSTSDKKKKTQYKITFIPIIKKKETASPSKAEATEIVWYDSEVSSTSIASIAASETEKATIVTPDKSAAEFAQRIWDEDNTVYNNLNHVVEWIGDGKASSNSILQSYMSHFDFKDMKLEQAFRSLCSKLYLKGETQQIDRILLQFSTRYFECNPKSIFGTTDIIHAIVYSLLLLNTDLHVAQGDYKKMSQSAFVKNTMEAISAQLEGTPASMMVSDKSSVQSLDWVPLQRTPSTKSDFSSRSYAQSLDSSMPCTFGSNSWLLVVKDLLKQMYTSIRHSQITNPSSPPTSMRINNRVSSTFKRSVVTIIWKNTRDSTVAAAADEETTSLASAASFIMQYQAVASHLQNTELPTSYISNAPYYKEGMVVRKHLLESKNQKAKHRDWKECFMVIERSQFSMYKFGCLKRSHSSHNLSDATSQITATSDVVGGSDWMSNAQLIGSIDLKHTLANALPSGYIRQRQHAFALQQSNGAVFVFQVGSAEQVNEWVSTCNYWAARESKEPLVGGISSMEYGWGNCLESISEEVMVYEWLAPACPTISSMLEESAQLEVLHKHVEELSAQLDQHRDIKPKMKSHFLTFTKFANKAMTNWENKSRYLLLEIIKYQNYCNSIEKSLALQADLSAYC